MVANKIGPDNPDEKLHHYFFGDDKQDVLVCMQVQISKRQSVLKIRVVKFLNTKNNLSVLTKIFTKYQEL